MIYGCENWSNPDNGGRKDGVKDGQMEKMFSSTSEAHLLINVEVP